MTENAKDPVNISLPEAAKYACADRRTVLKWIDCEIVQATKRPDGRYIVDFASLKRCLKPAVNPQKL